MSMLPGWLDGLLAAAAAFSLLYAARQRVLLARLNRGLEQLRDGYLSARLCRDRIDNEDVLIAFDTLAAQLESDAGATSASRAAASEAND